MKIKPSRGKFSKDKLILAMLLLVPFLATTAQLRINEFAALNSSLAFDPDFGEFSDYIELYNPTETPINLNGYSITDNPENPTKWVVGDIVLQPMQYLLIWADGRNKNIGDTAHCSYRNAIIKTSALHTNFSLSGDGEYLGIYDNSGRLIDEIHFGVQENNVTQGRSSENPTAWYYFSDPTPGKENSTFYAPSVQFASEPTCSSQGGFFADAHEISLTASSVNAIVKYTLDGSDPTFTSPTADGPITIFRNFTLKARTYEKGKLPGTIISKSFFIGENIDLPVVSIATNSDHTDDYDFGIFRNSIKEREVPASIQYFDKNGTSQFSENVGIRLFGSTIYNLPQKPISVRCKGKFGASQIHYKLFDDRDNETFKSFQLRNGGNDHNLAYFRDGLATSLIKGEMDIDYQAYKPCVVYINGDYQGIYEIRERLDADYLAANNNISSATVSIIEDSSHVVTGDGKSFENLKYYLINNSLQDTKNYEYVASIIDIDEYINYMINKIFIGYKLFDLNNKYWQKTDGKWRWIANDMEHAFGEIGGDEYDQNTLVKVLNQNNELPQWATLVFSKLMENNSFRSSFSQRFSTYLNTIYQPNYTISKVDSLTALLKNQMPRHIYKWKTPFTMNVWQGNINFIKEFLTQRPKYIRNHLSEYLGAKDSALVRINIVGNGNIYIENSPIKNQSFSGYYFEGVPLNLIAVPQLGYRFVGWQGIDNDNVSLAIIPKDTTTLVAVFEPIDVSIVPGVIATNTLLSASKSPWYVTSDVIVMAGAKLTVEAGTEIMISDNASFYIYGGFDVKGEPNKQVVIKSNSEKWARKPFHNKQARWGVIAAINATDSIKILNAQINGSGFGNDRIKQFAGISSLNSNCHLLNVTITDNIQPFYSEFGSVYIGYSTLRSQNTCDLINIKYSDNPIVEGCDLKGNNAPDTDAIDYDGVNNGIILNNNIYGFRGDNSDGIDLGEGAKNVLIQSNTIYSCSDKGISIGQASTATIENNIIFACNMGIAVKDLGSEALIDKNTLYANDYAIACYEKNSGRGGGIATVRNSILSESFVATLLADKLSVITVSYSISDKELMPGNGNIYADPLLSLPQFGNFELSSNSPCIDSGDPNSKPDADDSRADMGAYYKHQNPEATPIILISEINYHSPENYDSGDWIEISNIGNQNIDLSGWVLALGPNRIVVKNGTIIQAKNALVFCADEARFSSLHPTIENKYADTNLILGNISGKVDLLDSNGKLVQMVNYSSRSPWPTLPGGLGATLELDGVTGNLANSFWRESYILGGTPGKSQSMPKLFDQIRINELMASNINTIADEYGEYDDWFELYNAGDSAIDIGGLYITDKPDNATKWQVPLHKPHLTTISPKGFLLLWADNKPEQGVLHTNFALSASGESLALFRRDGKIFEPIQHLNFGPQTNTHSYGCYPDGSTTFSTLLPTPKSTNIKTSINSPLENGFSVYPNPFTDYTIFTSTLVDSRFQIQVADISGRIVYKAKSSNQRAHFSRGALPNGVYIYTITFNTGEQYFGKLIIK